MQRFAAHRLFTGCLVLFLSVLVFPAAVQGESWNAAVGAQSTDMGKQGLAFLPNEMWIHAGDSITWTVETDEIHTITFLTSGQIRPPFQAGCPGTTANGSSEDGTACVNSGPLVSGQTYTINFPAAGNFKLACLVHANMTATIHVLALSEALPHDQAFYDAMAAKQQRELMTDPMPTPNSAAGHGVTTGIGEVVGNGGGFQTVSVMRFMSATKLIHVGDTVEWNNNDPVTPHTITFGAEPANVIPPSGNVTIDADGARHATVSSPADNVHSGFIMAAPQDRIGLAQAPLSFTRFRVTFTAPGIFNYKCSLHDNLGMVGEVIVLP